VGEAFGYSAAITHNAFLLRVLPAESQKRIDLACTRERDSLVMFRGIDLSV
jgi:hypothetical protein